MFSSKWKQSSKNEVSSYVVTHLLEVNKCIVILLILIFENNNSNIILKWK